MLHFVASSVKVSNAADSYTGTLYIRRFSVLFDVTQTPAALFMLFHRVAVGYPPENIATKVVGKKETASEQTWMWKHSLDIL